MHVLVIGSGGYLLVGPNSHYLQAVSSVAVHVSRDIVSESHAFTLHNCREECFLLLNV